MGSSYKNNKQVNYHISSSIWLGLKSCISMVFRPSTWKLGNGGINLWADTWLFRPIVDIIGIPCTLHKDFKTTLSNFIVNGRWSIFADLIAHFPQLHSDLGLFYFKYLTFKDAFLFHNLVGQVVPWTNAVLKNFIPPSKSFILWRILQNKMPIDDQLWIWECTVVSICSLCGSAIDTSHHIFLACSFAQHIWTWLWCILSIPIDTSSF